MLEHDHEARTTDKGESAHTHMAMVAVFWWTNSIDYGKDAHVHIFHP
jgi:hypothetical protein